MSRYSGMTLGALEAMEARAKAGLPEPGDNYACGWCGGPTTVYVDDLPRNVSPLTARTICPCCSPAKPPCVHRFPDCPVCHCSTAPTGTYASGGPFVRCDGSETHR